MPSLVCGVGVNVTVEDGLGEVAVDEELALGVPESRVSELFEEQPVKAKNVRAQRGKNFFIGGLFL